MYRAVLRRRRLRPNVNKFSMSLYKRIKRIWNEAIREFVRAIVTGDLIKVDTGMSKGSLLPLSRAVRMLTSVKIGSTRSRKGYTDISGVWHPGVLKNVALGKRIGESMFKINYGSEQRVRLVFEFHIEVYQYLLHEYGYGTLPAWNTLETGFLALQRYLQDNAKEVFPPFNEWLEFRID